MWKIKLQFASCTRWCLWCTFICHFSIVCVLFYCVICLTNCTVCDPSCLVSSAETDVPIYIWPISHVHSCHFLLKLRINWSVLLCLSLYLVYFIQYVIKGAHDFISKLVQGTVSSVQSCVRSGPVKGELCHELLNLGSLGHPFNFATKMKI